MNFWDCFCTRESLGVAPLQNEIAPKYFHYFQDETGCEKCPETSTKSCYAFFSCLSMFCRHLFNIFAATFKHKYELLFTAANLQALPREESLQKIKCSCAGTTPILENRSENEGARENLSCGFPSIPGIAPGVALRRIVVFGLLKSWDAIPRMEFRIPRTEFRTPRAAPRMPRNSPRAARMAFSLRERFPEIGLAPSLLIRGPFEPRHRKP